ncbi:hypothetical protein QYE76_044988 [Lolium multiflorum]|uniref:Trichome birefringence-like N-terminal domain-containing protein n=1 Tax=Lolium multiflorum TaxID=4521 RepID=A0AAD8TJL6_LOLMU|nr:hypothetical protein QYE76_044988 [Lolium multiflorum]
MAGWRKAWLSALDRSSGGGGGGSTGSLQAQLQGILSLSPSTSSSSLATSYSSKRAGGKHGGVSSKAVLACFSVVLVLAFFYVSVTRGPTADDSFPTPTASSSGALLSWLSSSSNSSTPKKPLPPHPPVPPTNVSTSTGAAAQQSSARNATVADAEDSAPAVDSGQPVPVPEQSVKAHGFLRDAGNTTIAGSDGEPATNGTNAQDATAMPTPPWWKADGANSSAKIVVGEPTNSDGATGNSTDTVVSSSKEDKTTKTSSVDNVLPSSTRQAAVIPSTPPPDQRKEDRHRRKRAAMARRRQHSTRRRKEIVPLAQGEPAAAAGHGDGAATPAAGANTSVSAGAGNHRVVWTPGVQNLVTFAKCDLFHGGWVREESYAFYPPRSCPHIDDDFNCHKNGREDTGFLNWRWQPSGCDIPRMNVTDFLERLRGQRIIFVGDSLGRNMWESLVCTLRHGVKNKKSVYERSGKNQFKTRGYYSFKFGDYNCSVDFIRSIFLVNEVVRESKNGTVLDAKLRLDELDATTPAYQTADIVVFNTGHWWTHAKTSKGVNYYQEGNHVHPSLEVMDAYKRGLTTWARWVDKNIDSRRTQVVFRGYSLTHFRGGQWNSGGRCHRETEPIFNQTYLTEYPEKMRILDQVLSKMKTPVIHLNISRLTDYRKDGHPSVYRVRYDTEEERMAAITKQDCSHWCLPGVPDTWNQLLYASLLQAGKGSWRL